MSERENNQCAHGVSLHVFCSRCDAELAARQVAERRRYSQAEVNELVERVVRAVSDSILHKCECDFCLGGRWDKCPITRAAVEAIREAAKP
jgi:hypothetical protein